MGALLAAQVLAETGLAEPDPNLQERHERKRRRVRDWQVRLLGGSVLPARERVLAGDLLARLGDTRRHLLDVDEMRLCAVPQGAFWMGEEGDSSAPHHRNEALDYDYWIGQAPVSVAQFGQFVTSCSYPWSDPEGLQAMENRPVVGMSWHDALAFCAWLGDRWRKRLPTGWSVTLPSEPEWEKAARGGECIPAVPQVTTVNLGLPQVLAGSIDNPLPRHLYPWGEEFTAE